MAWYGRPLSGSGQQVAGNATKFANMCSDYACADWAFQPDNTRITRLCWLNLKWPLSCDDSGAPGRIRACHTAPPFSPPSAAFRGKKEAPRPRDKGDCG